MVTISDNQLNPLVSGVLITMATIYLIALVYYILKRRRRSRRNLLCCSNSRDKLSEKDDDDLSMSYTSCYYSTDDLSS